MPGPRSRSSKSKSPAGREGRPGTAGRSWGPEPGGVGRPVVREPAAQATGLRPRPSDPLGKIRTPLSETPACRDLSPDLRPGGSIPGSRCPGITGSQADPLVHFVIPEKYDKIVVLSPEVRHIFFGRHVRRAHRAPSAIVGVENCSLRVIRALAIDTRAICAGRGIERAEIRSSFRAMCRSLRQTSVEEVLPWNAMLREPKDVAESGSTKSRRG